MNFWSRSSSGATTTLSSSKGILEVEEHALPTLRGKGAGLARDDQASNIGRNLKSLLPSPVLANSTSSHRPRPKKSARIDQGLKVHWARFKKRIGNSNEAPSESLLDGGESTEGGNSLRKAEHRSEDERTMRYDGEDEEEPAPVDEVIVDRVWLSSDHEKTSVTPSEQGGHSPDKSGGSHQPGTSTDHESLLAHAEGFWGLCTPLTLLRWRLWPVTLEFFSSRFYDDKAEAHYRKEIWFTSKVHRLIACL